MTRTRITTKTKFRQKHETKKQPLPSLRTDVQGVLGLYILYASVFEVTIPRVQIYNPFSNRASRRLEIRPD